MLTLFVIPKGGSPLRTRIRTTMQIITEPIRHTPGYRKLRRIQRLWTLRRRIRQIQPLNVVIGAGGTVFTDWVSTDLDLLDITSPYDWQNIFRPESIDRLLAEHVLEHLSEAQCRAALGECHRYLKPSGSLRIAVPDGYRRDFAYVAEVSPPK